MTPSEASPNGRDDVVDRVLASDRTNARLRALLAAASAPSDVGPQPGESEALAAFRELVTEPAGVPSLVARRRARLALVAASSAFVVISTGVAAAATGSLPDPAQQIARTVLGSVGVHVPSPNRQHPAHPAHPATSPAPQPGATVPPGGTHTSHPAHPTHPVHPSTQPEPSGHPTHPAHPSASPTPGNSGLARHHGNPTPTATAHPTPHHGKPSSPPVTSHRTPHPTPRNSRAPVL